MHRTLKKSIITTILMLSIIFTNLSTVCAENANQAMKNDIIEVSTRYIDPKLNDNVYLVEEYFIDGNFYKFMHKVEDGFNIVEVSGTENMIIKAPINSNENQFSSSAKVLYKTAYSDEWHQLGETVTNERLTIESSQAAIATALSVIFGGPIGAFLGIAGVLRGISAGRYLNVTCVSGGKWRNSGTHIEYQKYAKVYDSNGNLIGTTYWSSVR
ncbi:hypothetical protein SAMN00017477_2223 [Peptoniphilus asaccharolyticus DSM 20463]|uniref:Uncharacterized protein n=1 Tax=Peptoniphilus asaccharolyticus DSM 20463 TaxID=573058 RepID=A0A1W1VMW2_PEPAS|nr:hypothetical protein [Peptoniphilus asaccharolyticus]MBL7574538.1 hypothetical protein [Peptoniphilus asaccharolyticus]SMB94391.1 hypothetical protein SAMN00017477_2223 [Peptoniphilus asaccharolyticus DSM 20463]